MNWPHWIILPIILPLLSGAVLLMAGRRAPVLAARVGLASTALLLAVAVGLMARADSGPISVYLLGNWQAPFGIALALDRLTALMLVLTAIVAMAALTYGCGGDDRRGAHFHALFQFQLMGLNGAFLTADLFNLFVFFEVLLISSYGLLLHGAGAARLRAATHYVSFNLTGSALFLIAVSLLYGLTGTLNMADLAVRLGQLPADRTLLAQSAALLLLVVFFVKAALLPLYFWLPATYGAASAPVAALFAIMTKVGVYAVLRVTSLMFGTSAGSLAGLAHPWLPALALTTMALGAIGVLAAQHLRAQIGCLVIASAGTLLLAVGLARPDTVAAGLVYMVNSTLAAAGLFLLADRISYARAGAGDRLHSAAFDATKLAQGVLFFTFAVAAAGVPPLAGFIGKAMLLKAAGSTPWAVWVISLVLASSLLLMVALARSGSVLFWRPAGASPSAPPGGQLRLVTHHRAHGTALLALCGLLIVCSVCAGPLSRYTSAAAQQLFEPRVYIEAVLGARPVPAAIDVRREMREAAKSGETAK